MLWERSLWRNPGIDLVFGTRIVEYDMKSAGLNLIIYYKLLPDDQIQELQRMEKHAKDVKIGLLQKHDKEFTKKLSDAFAEARRMFFEANALSEENVLAIKKDAIFTMDVYPKETHFENLEFVPKNTYSSFLYLNRLEFYLNTKTKVIDIKGLGQKESLDEVRNMHGEYMLKFIMRYSAMLEKHMTNEDMMRWLSSFVRKYRAKKLAIEYYRQLGPGNSYMVYNELEDDYMAVAETIEIDKVDIRYNYFNYIVPLAQNCI
jgi:hypothetical protein